MGLHLGQSSCLLFPPARIQQKPSVQIKHGRACRHMYKILRRRPKVQDAKVRWHLRYLLEYGRNEETSRKYMRMRDHLDCPGVPITVEEWTRISYATEVGVGERDLAWFVG